MTSLDMTPLSSGEIWRHEGSIYEWWVQDENTFFQTAGHKVATQSGAVVEAITFVSPRRPNGYRSKRRTRSLV